MEIDRKYLIENPEPELFSEELEVIMDQKAEEIINLPSNQPPSNINVVFGVNRSATAAVATALLQLNYFAIGHSQPFKSARRNIWNIMSRGYGIQYDNDRLNIPTTPVQAIIIKETNGGKRQCDYSKPFSYLLGAGYPSEKLTGVIVWRNPLALADSWERLGGWRDEIPALINVAFRKTAEQLAFALRSGVGIVEIFLDDLKTDNGALTCFQKVIDTIVPQELSGQEDVRNMIHWRSNKTYDQYMLHYQKPPQKYIAGVSQTAGGKMRFVYQERAEELMFGNSFRRSQIKSDLQESYAVYLSRLEKNDAPSN